MIETQTTQEANNEASKMKQFITSNENPYEVIMATLTEAVVKLTNGHLKATRKVNGYQANSTLKASQMKALNDEMATVNPSMEAIKEAGFRPVKTLRANLNPRTYTLGDFDALDLILKPQIRHAVACLVSLRKFTKANMAEVENSGQNGIELDLIEASFEQCQAFGLTTGDFIRYVEVDSSHLIRDGMDTLKQLNDKRKGTLALDSRNRVEGVTVHRYALQGDGVDCLKAHLEINASTVLEWSTNGHAAAWYCPQCQKMNGYQQVMRAKACPQCPDMKKRDLVPQSVTVHLPVLNKVNGGLKTYGGHRVHFMSARIPKRLYNLMESAHTGAISTTQLMQACLKDDGSFGQFSTRLPKGKGWSKSQYRAVPVSFDVSVGGSRHSLLSIALEMRPTDI